MNFFFGYNSSGKSTIAKFLRDVSITETEKKNNDYKTCFQVGYDSTKNEILVFDEYFIEDNFHKQQNFKGVFSLDKKNQNIKNNLDKLHCNSRETYYRREKYPQPKNILLSFLLPNEISERAFYFCLISGIMTPIQSIHLNMRVGMFYTDMPKSKIYYLFRKSIGEFVMMTLLLLIQTNVVSTLV